LGHNDRVDGGKLKIKIIFKSGASIYGLLLFMWREQLDEK
jgi:hypothetical protein